MTVAAKAFAATVNHLLAREPWARDRLRHHIGASARLAMSAIDLRLRVGDDGYLVYSFAEVVAAMHPYYVLRALGGMLYLAGGIVMAVNVTMTILGKVRSERPLVGALAQAKPAV